MEQPLKCQVCGDVIGAYEPLLMLTKWSVRETSLAAEPRIHETPGDHYHRACYLGAGDVPSRTP
jgi:hypothetical protein